jgi:hypothetical protein
MVISTFFTHNFGLGFPGYKVSFIPALFECNRICPRHFKPRANKLCPLRMTGM